jgi:hypothetical protein
VNIKTPSYIYNMKNNKNNAHIKGELNGYNFDALVFEEESEYGINEGRVSKLFVSRNGKNLITYDRKWELKPSMHILYIYDLIINKIQK